MVLPSTEKVTFKISTQLCKQLKDYIQAYLITDPQVAEFNEDHQILELTQISGVSVWNKVHKLPILTLK